MSNKVAQTIRLSDTTDQYSRRVHINVRNGKATMVYRWKDRYSNKRHTQRMTLDDAQAFRLVTALGAAAIAAVKATGREAEAHAILDRMSNVK